MTAAAPRRLRRLALGAAVVAGAVASGATAAGGAGTVGTTFPPGFVVPIDHSLQQPVIGFGSAEGEVERTPVVFLHGNNDTPYPTTCNGSYGKPQAFAQYFLDHGYSPKEVWGLGYQGDQCDLLTDQTRRAKEAHTTVANVPDLRAFVKSVLEFTGASQVDIVGHSLGHTLAREWMRQDNAYATVRRLVGVDGPNHGIINCSPNPLNYYHSIGFVPDSPVCLEYGAAGTPFLARLNAGDETPGPTEHLVIVNADTSFVYISAQDGVLPPVPAEDRNGRPHDFSRSARLDGAETVELRGQGKGDGALLAAHTGIVNTEDTWKAAFDFLTRPEPVLDAGGGAGVTPAPDPAAQPTPAAPAPAGGGEHPATGAGVPWPAAIALAAGVFIGRFWRPKVTDRAVVATKTDQ